ncbi:MAG: chorismate mutase [Cyanobacteria bacterium]|nr:chorismate mutase [Cyanobacteriota bacterium]
MLKAVRGATTIPTATPLEGDPRQVYRDALLSLVKILLEKNHIASEQILSVFFTVTPDLTAYSPAKIVREAMGWDTVAIMCAQEPVIEDFPDRCVRILIQWEPSSQEAAAQPVSHAYLNNAAGLRPDWSS